MAGVKRLVSNWPDLKDKKQMTMLDEKFARGAFCEVWEYCLTRPDWHPERGSPEVCAKAKKQLRQEANAAYQRGKILEHLFGRLAEAKRYYCEAIACKLPGEEPFDESVARLKALGTAVPE